MITILYVTFDINLIFKLILYLFFSNKEFRSKSRVLYGTNAGGGKNPVCDVSLKIIPKLVLGEKVAKAGVVNAGY